MVNFGDEILFFWQLWRQKSDPMGDFRSLLVPKEGSRRLYLNQHYDLDLGVAMRFEKRVDVKRDRSLFRKRVDFGSDRRLAFIFSGSGVGVSGRP